MTTNETIKSNIDSLKNKTESILLAPRSNNEFNHEYWFAAFEDSVLNPFIKYVIQELDRLPPNKILKNKLEYWIEELEDFLEFKLQKVASKANLKHQGSYIKELISRLSDKNNQITEYLAQKEIQSDIDSKLIELTRDEIALLMLYLQEVKAIFPYGIIENKDLAHAFGILSGFSEDQLEKSIAGKARTYKNEITTYPKNYNKLKQKLSIIIDLIKNDLESFS